MSRKTEAITCGRFGALHTMGQKIGSVEAIDRRLHLLKVNLPYHESAHVLNIAYNILTGGMRLEDIELHRQDATFMNGLGAQRIPDQTTAGDFTRRFDRGWVQTLMHCTNENRGRVWAARGKCILDEALIDIGGMLAPTLGERKEDMEYSYKGIWGYHPLVVSLANTKEVLLLDNRPANGVSHKGRGKVSNHVEKPRDRRTPCSKSAALQAIG